MINPPKLFRKNRQSYFFSHEKKNETTIFHTKDEGVTQILKLLINDDISIFEANYIFLKLMRIRHLPTADSKPYAQFYYDVGIIKKFEKINALLSSFIKSQKEYEAKYIFPAFVFYEDFYEKEEKVSLILKDGNYVNIKEKNMAFLFIEDLFKKNEIDLHKKNLMEKEIKESKLSKNKPEENIHLN